MEESKEPPKEEILDRCTCKEYDYPEHPCPFPQEISGDETSCCCCCPYCEYQCAMDI